MKKTNRLFILALFMAILVIGVLTGCKQEVSVSADKLAQQALEEFGDIDGIYRCSFTNESLQTIGGHQCLEFQTYFYDTYERRDFEPGTHIIVNQKEYEVTEVKSVSGDNACIMVNGTLLNKEDAPTSGEYRQFIMSWDLGTGVYRLYTGTDYPLYQSAATYTLPLADEVCIYESSSDESASEERFHYENLPSCLFGENYQDYTPENTEIKVQNGKIVSLTHFWVP